MTRASVAQRLEALADQLDPDLAHELRRLAAADSTAHQLLHAQDRARRAEDLATECKRQLRSLERQLVKAHAERCAPPSLDQVGTSMVTVDIAAGHITKVLGPARVHLGTPGAAPRPVAADPTHGRIDPDIQTHVDQMKPGSLAQRIENTLQRQRARGRA